MKKRFPVPPVIIFALILIAALLTWVLPGGQYIEGEFYPVESKPQTWQVFSAFFEGFSRQSGIIVFILVIGAAFGLSMLHRPLITGYVLFLNSP